MRKLMICAVFAALVSTPVTAQQNQPPAVGFNAKWVPLFNGKDLTGWKVVGPERWTVDDGTILGEGIHGKDGFLKTGRKYRNFHAFLRFKCETPNNSGFFYHSDIEDDISRIRFIQVEISSSIGGHTGGLHGDNISEEDGRGWIVWPAPELETVLRPFDWNEMLVQVEGNRIRTHLNGVQMIDSLPPAVVISAPPAVYPVPGSYAYFAPDVGLQLFFHSGHWYRPYNGYWYRASYYNGPWYHLPPSSVPVVFNRYTYNYYRYYKVPPGQRLIPYGHFKDTGVNGTEDTTDGKTEETTTTDMTGIATKAGKNGKAKMGLGKNMTDKS